jgi:Zn finger protein HypA/HybF involved in hydrogenase expression
MIYKTCLDCNTSVEIRKTFLDLNNRCPICDGVMYAATEPTTIIENDSTKKRCNNCDAYFPKDRATGNCPICSGPIINN